MLNCYYCIARLGLKKFAISLIGSDKKEFKKDFFSFCPDCFEYLFGTSIVFSTKKDVATSCHVCDSKVIGTLPYSYFINAQIFPNGDKVEGKRRMCGPCSTRELFPIITSLLIVLPKG